MLFHRSEVMIEKIHPVIPLDSNLKGTGDRRNLFFLVVLMGQIGVPEDNQVLNHEEL